jgi:hypothetical protein
MIRKDWYRTILVETKEGIDQMKEIRDILSEYRAEITDFDVERSKEGVNIILKLGLKFYSTKVGDQLMQDIGRLDGIKSVKWEVD